VAIDIYNDPHAEKRGEIIRRINQALPGAATVRPGKALSLTEDNKIVDADDPAAAFVLVGENGVLPADLAKELGIKQYKRSAQEEADAQARIDLGRGNVGAVNASAPTAEPMQKAEVVQVGNSGETSPANPAPSAEPQPANPLTEDQAE
jgi:hypothetical protein